MLKSVRLFFIASCLILVSCSGYSREFEHILHRWKNPSNTDIFVVAHRAAFMEGGQIILPENSVPSIEYAIELGVDMVELDIRATKDGRFVLIHDSTIDRTTNGSGNVADFTLEELREFSLINEVNGQLTEYKIPTLEEVYALVKGRIMVNLDPKLPPKDLGHALQMAKDAGVENQIMLKGTVDTDKQLEDIKIMLSELPFEAEFMPMHWDKNTQNLATVIKSFGALNPEAAEMIVNINPESEHRVTEDGGFLFSDSVRNLASKKSIHLWINSLYVDPLQHPESSMHYLMWNGGRHDILGLKYPDKVFGFWVNQGATIIQTDEPRFLIEYLRAQGLRSAD